MAKFSKYGNEIPHHSRFLIDSSFTVVKQKEP